MRASLLRVASCTTLALLGFAANSLLCREALSPENRHIDPASFTSVRLASGALVLALLLRLRGGASRAGSWYGAIALFLYAAGFSFAYVRLTAGAGALILFGAVQLTMLGSGIARGERPRAQEWVGLALAAGGLLVLTAPGASAPDPAGVLLMAIAGIAWGAYSLRGRGRTDPLAATADSFLRSVPLAAAVSLLAFGIGSAPHASAEGLMLALASGAVASGVGYTLWYTALPSLTSTRAAIVQLSVPVLAAVGGVLWMGEALSLRVAGGGASMLLGILLALLARAPGGAKARG